MRATSGRVSPAQGPGPRPQAGTASCFLTTRRFPESTRMGICLKEDLFCWVDGQERGLRIGEGREGGRGARAEQGIQGQPPMLELGRSAPWGLGIPCDPLDSISRELPRACRACRPVCGWAESRPGRVSCLG